VKYKRRLRVLGLDHYFVEKSLKGKSVGKGRLYKEPLKCEYCGSLTKVVENNEDFQKRICTNNDCKSEYKSHYIYPDTKLKFKNIEFEISEKLIPLCNDCKEDMEIMLEGTDYFHLRCIKCGIVVGGKLYDMFEFDKNKKDACPLCGCSIFEDSFTDNFLHCGNCYLIVDPNILDK
jgi:ribosomal protein S27AE